MELSQVDILCHGGTMSLLDPLGSVDIAIKFSAAFAISFIDAAM
jgi:hypothetical protein